jgi:hypothetical protein
MKNNFAAAIYQSERTVFTLKEISVLLEEGNFNNLKAGVNYYVKKKIIRNIRRGIYTKENYEPFELAVKLYPPAYISFETVLFKEGLIFQYDKTITAASYLSREIQVDDHNLRYRKLKDSILTSPEGLIFNALFTIAEKERAFLDILYLNRDFFADYTRKLDKKKIFRLVPIYENRELEKKVKEIFE